MLLPDEIQLIDADSCVPALTILEKESPDLVIVGISKGGTDGIDVLRRIRRSPGIRSTPVYALTSCTMEGDHDRFQSVGFDGFISTSTLITPDSLRKLFASIRHKKIGSSPEPAHSSLEKNIAPTLMNSP